jgi:phosphohistidine phosphatase
MKVYFLRHGVAVEPEKWEGADFDRPLTDEGRRRLPRQAKAMGKLALAFDKILTSPLLRAKETATIVADKLKVPDRLVEDERLGLDFDPDRLAGILNDHRSASAVMLVGHEPSMSATIGHLIGGARIELKKGALACVDVPDPSSLVGELVWLIPSKVLLL